MHRSVLEDQEFADWATENVVVLIAQPKGTHRPVDVAKPAKGEPKSQCPLYPGMTCEEHERAFAEFAKEGDDEKDKDKGKKKPSKKETASALPHAKISAFPSSFLISPDGSLEECGRWSEPKAWIDKVGEAQKKLDEHPIVASKLADVKKAVADAEKASKGNQWKAALAALSKVDEALPSGWPKALTERVKPWLDAGNAKALARLAEAKKAKDEAAQVKAVKAVRDEFGQALAAGALPAIADIDAWLSEHGAAAAGK